MSARIAVRSDDEALADAWLRALAADGLTGIAIRGGVGPWAAIRAFGAGIAVLDCSTTGALDLCAALANAHSLQVVAANVAGGDDAAVEALTAGARGLVHAGSPPQEVVKAVHAVDAGEVWAPRHIVLATWMRLRNEIHARAASEAAMTERLSLREREVFRFAAAGLGNKEVANRLAISEATVKVHLTHIFQKLGVRGRAELAAAFHGMRR
jgi:DNA-binding NarL/FixJ family response regulator